MGAQPKTSAPLLVTSAPLRYLLVNFAEAPEAIAAACTMLTRGRAAQARASPDTVLSPLPRCFVHAVFLRLPVDARLRCAEVSRAW